MSIKFTQEMLLEGIADKGGDFFLKQPTFGEHIQEVKARSRLAKLGLWTEDHTISLGQSCALFENYMGFLNEGNGTTSDVLALPTMGLDVISGIAAESIIPYVGSRQSLRTKKNIIWYRVVQASKTRGNVTAGDIIRDSRQAQTNYPESFAFAEYDMKVADETEVGITSYSIGLAGAPLKAGSVSITIPGLGIAESSDNGKGWIYGGAPDFSNSFQAQVNYANGSILLNLQNAPTSVENILVGADSDLELGDQAEIQEHYDSMIVEAKIQAMSGNTSIHKNYDFQQYFGINADSHNTELLISEMVSEENRKVANMLKAAALRVPNNTTQFNPNEADGVTLTQHLPSFMVKWELAGDKIYDNVGGRGEVKVVFAGSQVATMFAVQPHFVKATSRGEGVTVWGTIDDKVIIKCPHYDPLEAVGVHRGEGYIDAALVVGEYMPLYINGSIQGFENPAMKKGYATTVKSYTTPVDRYCTYFRLKSRIGLRDE